MGLGGEITLSNTYGYIVINFCHCDKLAYCVCMCLNTQQPHSEIIRFNNKWVVLVAGQCLRVMAFSLVNTIIL